MAKHFHAVWLRWKLWRARMQLRLLLDEESGFTFRAEEARAIRLHVEQEIRGMRQALVQLYREAR